MSDPPQCLDWRDRKHWSHLAKPCRHCGDLTHLRDNQRRASHKICAEKTLNQKEDHP